MNISRISIERPTIVAVIFSLLIIMGSLSYYFLNYELVPEFNPPVLSVTTVYPGASPTEVESSISRKIEDAVSTLENIETITSISMESFSLIRLEMKSGTDIDEALQEADRLLNLVIGQLPATASKPTLSRFDFDDLPVIRGGAYSTLPESDFYNFAQNQILPVISQVEGVAQVRLLGGRETEVKVDVDPEKLQVYGVSLLQILQAVNAGNLNIPAGRIATDENQNFIRFRGRFTSLDQIRDLVVFEVPQISKTVRLGDVAGISFSPSDRSVITRINGREALGFDIRKQSDANAVNMSAAVRDNLSDLEDKYSDIELHFDLAQDTSLFTIEAANAVMTDLFYAIILVSLVMLIFLHSIRNSLIVLASIPTSIISTFIIMYLLGYTLNLLTLLGLSLAIGILVDDSIVVLENIHRHIEMGKTRVRSAYEGRMEIGFTAVSITLIDVVVFLPIIFSQGLVADMLRQYSVVIVTSTMLSLFVSFTLVPLLTSRFSKHERIEGKTLAGKMILWFEKFLGDVTDQLENALRFAFRNKLLTTISAAILFILSLSLIYFGFIGLEFTKAGDRSEFLLELELPKDATLSRTNEAALLAESYLLQQEEVENIFTTAGSTSSGRIEFNTAYLAELNVRLVEKKDRDISTSIFAREAKLELESSMPGLKVRPIDINLIGLRDDDAVQVVITGNDQDTLSAFARKIEDLLTGISGTVEVQSSLSEGRTEYAVIPDREAMQLLGINLSQAGYILRTAFSGNNDAKYEYEGEEYDIHIRLDDFNRTSIADIRNLSVVNREGNVIRISQFARIEAQESYAQLERTNRSASVTIKSQVIGRPAGTVGNELRQKMNRMKIPEGIRYFFAGQTKRTMDGVRTMLVALFIAILLVYMILVALYDSYIYPFVVLFSIPLAIIGALLALALTMESLSIFSILGMVMLVGLVGKNAILVVDFTNKLRENGMEWQNALITASKLRFRPILMTNISMIIGLLPIALAGGAGSEWKNGLAWALIGGLSSSMFLTLIVVPVIYYVVERGLEKTGLAEKKKVRVPRDVLEKDYDEVAG
ncbi:MAG: efflux RND transporter permease subunit [Cyclobacteriaceae bacterium]|nr:efflux RND transporter permease subunit [Cyclobacteriaceae bacterium]